MSSSINLTKQAEALQQRSFSLLEHIPAGQPVMSTKHRNTLDNVWELQRKANELLKEAESSNTLENYVKNEIKKDNIAKLKQDNSIQVGDKIKVYWTNCNRHFSAVATIIKINAKTILTTLDHEVVCNDLGNYPAGNKISVPIFGTKGNRWEKL